MGSDVKTLVKIGTAIAIAYFAPSMYTTAGGIGWLSVAVVTASVVISASLTVAPRARNSSLQQRSYSAQTSNRSLMIKQPVMARDMVYGLTKKSGGLLFMDTSDNNKYLHIIVQVASHEIEEFTYIYFNDEKLTITSDGNDANGIARYRVTSPSTYGTDSIYGDGKKTVRFKLHKGSDTQLADADLVSETEKWTTDHRLRGIAYIYARISYDPDAFPNGLPNISAEIKGKKVLDIRNGSTAFSANPALILYDYFTDTKIGLGIDTSNIDSV